MTLSNFGVGFMTDITTFDKDFEVVDDKEVLYRRVENEEFCFQYDEQTNTLEVTRHAFNDRFSKPSVDRAKLCNNDPKWTQWDHEEAGVVCLVAKEVRAIDPPIVSYDNNQHPINKHEIDVLPDPITEIKEPGDRINLAHAQIVSTPQAKSGAFNRLKIALADIARKRGWLIKPLPFRN
jgi:hypothetical protein